MKKKITSIVSITFAALLLILYFSYRSVNQITQALLLKNLERKSLSQLNLYHEGIKRITKEKIKNKLEVLTNLSQSNYLHQALQQNNLTEVENILSQRNQIDEPFDRLIILDKKGSLLTIVGLSEEDRKKIVHGNYSYREYYKQVISTKKSYISNVFFATGDYYVIAYSVPIFNEQKEISHILVASDLLTSLTDEFNFKTNFDSYYSILTDGSGNLLVDDIKPVKTKVNLKNSDRFVADFITDPKEKFGEVVNYRKERTYAQGSVIDLGTNKTYLISYYSIKDLQNQSIDIKRQLAENFISITIVSFVVFIIPWSIIFLIINRQGQ